MMLCKHCRYFAVPMGADTERCFRHPSTGTDPLWGWKDGPAPDARAERRDPSACGPEGRYWEPSNWTRFRMLFGWRP